MDISVWISEPVVLQRWKKKIKKPQPTYEDTHHLLGGSYEVTEDMAMVLD